jgi:DNA repair exonuclease SbcCD ATPase subunit
LRGEALTTTDTADRKAAVEKAHDAYRARIVACRAELVEATAAAHAVLLAADLERADDAHSRVEVAKRALEAAEAAEQAIAAASEDLAKESARLELEEQRAALTSALEASYVQLDARIDDVRGVTRDLAVKVAGARGLEQQVMDVQSRLRQVRTALGEQVAAHGQPRPWEQFTSDYPLYGALATLTDPSTTGDRDF